MTRTGYRLPFRLLGIPVYLDVTFLIILPLLAWLIASRLDVYARLFRLPIEPAQLQQGPLPYLLGLMAAIGLFASVVIHELGHAVVGRRYGVRVRRIVLWILGGVAEFEEMPRQPGAEAIVAIAGPIISFALAGICRGLLAVVPPEVIAARFVFGYLAFTNVAVAAFNLLPALPLDGGRILRSVLALRLEPFQATQISVTVARFLAILLGLFGFLSGNPFLVLIAFFIYIAGIAEAQSALFAEMLEGIGVQDLMTRNVATVTPHVRVTDLIERMLKERRLGYPVLDEGDRLVGIVTLEHLQGAEPTATVREVMSQRVMTMPQTGTALEAFRRMSRNNFGRVVVLGPDRRMVGILSKTDLMRAVQVRLVGLALLAEAEKS